jgi:hypothetical protein
MSIFKDVANFFSDLFRGAAEKAWAHLHEDAKDNAITGANFAQVIKESIGVGYDEFISRVSAETKLSTEQIEGVLDRIAEDLGITAEGYDNIYIAIQDKANTVLSDTGWNALFQNIAKFVSIYLTSGKLDWITLSLGVAQIAYEKFQQAKKKSVA